MLSSGRASSIAAAAAPLAVAPLAVVRVALVGRAGPAACFTDFELFVHRVPAGLKLNTFAKSSVGNWRIAWLYIPVARLN
jgi:hypothetical protein